MIGVIKGTMRQKKEVSGLPLPIASYKANLKAPIRSLKVAITAKQSGSGTPAPDNIRPIIGRSNVNVVDMSDITNIDYFQGLLNGTYNFVDLGSLTWGKSSQATNTFVATGNIPSDYPQSRGDGQVINAIISCGYNAVSYNSLKSSGSDKVMSYRSSASGKGLAIRDSDYSSYYDDFDADTFKAAMSGIYLIYATTSTITPTITEEQFNSLLTAFGISGYCVNIALGDTYYGGSLNVTTGVLTVTWKSADLSTLGYTKTQSGLFLTISLASSIKKADSGSVASPYIKSSHFNAIDSQSITGPQGSTPSSNGVMAENISGHLYFNYTDVTTVDDFRAAMQSVNFIYELATPITVQLTPTQVEQLLVNNVFADTGDVEELEYTDRQVYYGR